MSLSKLVLLVWVLAISVLVKGWQADHTWLPMAVFVLGIAYVVVYLLEWLGVLTTSIKAPARRNPTPDV